MKNTAFVFVKPHAATEKTRDLVAEELKKRGINISQSGTIEAKEIDSKQYIDNHYYAIASKATILKPAQLNVPAEKFQAFFGLGWQEALDAGKVFNAADACTKLGINADELNSLWAACKKNKKLIKFGGGFYCGEIQPGMYAFNGFFMTMRSKYVEAGAKIMYFVVDWNEDDLSWDDFRGKVLGPTDPTGAPEDSVRGIIYKQWESLGLPAQPDTGDNGVHASASPFEALAERCNWLGQKLENDEFGQALLAAGISKERLLEWSVDPVVKFAQPCKSSLFDSLEDMNSSDCLAMAKTINASQHCGCATAGSDCSCKNCTCPGCKCAEGKCPGKDAAPTEAKKEAGSCCSSKKEAKKEEKCPAPGGGSKAGGMKGTCVVSSLALFGLGALAGFMLSRKK